MPWTTPTLDDLRKINRDNVTSLLRSGPIIPNSVLRVMCDSNAGLAYLTLLYLNWLSLQFLPDTAETEWLDRWGNLFLTNEDATKGRKNATSATGTASVSGLAGIVIPSGTILNGAAATATGGVGTVSFITTAPVTLGTAAVTIPVTATTPGSIGNLDQGATLGFQTAIAGVNGNVTVIALSGGADAETDDELRARVLIRLQQPPMGGDAEDYVEWALAFPGVTRAWCSPREMGIGTVTLRFMMDDLRASSNGFPNPGDVTALQAWIDSKRPVTVIDVFVEAPIPETISFTLSNLDPNDSGTLADITTSVTAMLKDKAAPAYAKNGVTQPAQTIYGVWVSDAVFQTAGVESFDFSMADHPMPTPGSIAVLGNIFLT